jgi:hypothetical protein
MGAKPSDAAASNYKKPLLTISARLKMKSQTTLSIVSDRFKNEIPLRV